MSFTEWFVLAVMVIIIIMYLRRFYGEVEFVLSDVDGRSYLVRLLSDRQEAADRLARLNLSLTQLVQHMVAKFPYDKRVHLLYENYNADSLSEGGGDAAFTSYSQNKGEKIVMCLRQTNHTFVDANVVLYVAVHELGHLMTAKVGHTDGFWANFKWLLEEAISTGLYRKVDYANTPQSYCGISITSSVV
jgi:hypothetical protein